MARKLRVIVVGITSSIAATAVNPFSPPTTDRRRLLGRLAEVPERFRVEIHASVLMDNHYHLLLRTQDANLSDAIRWLQVAYSRAFNGAHGVSGHLF